VKREQLVKMGKVEPLAKAHARQDLRKSLEKALTRLDSVDVRDICDEVVPVIDGMTPLISLERINV